MYTCARYRRNETLFCAILGNTIDYLFQEGVTHDKGLTIIRSSKGRPMNAFSHADGKQKYTKKGKQRKVEHVYDGTGNHKTIKHVYNGDDEHDKRFRDARIRDWDMFEGYESAQYEPLEEFHDTPYSRNAKSHFVNNGRTIVFNGEEERHGVRDMMHPDYRDIEGSKVKEVKATVFSGDDRGDKGLRKDLPKSTETRHSDDVRPQHMQPAGAEQSPEKPQDDKDNELSRQKRTDDDDPHLERVKRFDDDEPTLERMKRLDEHEPTLERVKRLDEDEPTLERVKRLDEDEPTLERVKRLNEDEKASLHREKRSDDEKSLNRVKRLGEVEFSHTRAEIHTGKPKIFEGLPIEPQVTRFGDDSEAFARLKQMQNERLRKYDEEHSGREPHDDNEKKVGIYR